MRTNTVEWLESVLEAICDLAERNAELAMRKVCDDASKISFQVQFEYTKEQKKAIKLEYEQAACARLAKALIAMAVPENHVYDLTCAVGPDGVRRMQPVPRDTEGEGFRYR